MQPQNKVHILRQKAVALRKRGLLQSEIAKELQVSKSTLHGWLKDVVMDVDIQQKINIRLSESKKNRHVAMTQARKKIRLGRESAICEQAFRIVSEITLTRDQKKLLCAIFFWCEGGKDTSSGWQFINSDPVMVKTFLTLLRESFTVDETKFRALVHLHDYHDVELQQQYWSEIMSIPRSQFHKPFLKPHTGKQKKPGYPGCVSIRYLDRQFGLLLQMLYTNFGKTF